MKVGVPRETYPGDRRVALVPQSLPALKKAGVELVVESGAGAGAGHPDAAYQEKGARIVPDAGAVFSDADFIALVRAGGANAERGADHIRMLREGQYLMAFLEPLASPEVMKQLAQTKASVFAMELMPRITRAQSMDALSSMATVSGYMAVLMAAQSLPKFFPMFMTAAGTISPARVFILGAGVAGLQAISTARRLGAVVEAYDVRPAVKEQVESLGARFVDLPLETAGAEDAGGYAKEQTEEFKRKQQELMAERIKAADVVITTALVPGRRAPVLVPASVVEEMRPGSVIVDIAAEKGGNCELTTPGETVVRHGISIIGPVNLAASLPTHASQMYSTNMTTFLQHLVKDGAITLNLEDEITKGSLVAHGGEVVHPAVLETLRAGRNGGTA